MSFPTRYLGEGSGVYEREVERSPFGEWRSVRCLQNTTIIFFFLPGSHHLLLPVRAFFVSVAICHLSGTLSYTHLLANYTKGNDEPRLRVEKL